MGMKFLLAALAAPLAIASWEEKALGDLERAYERRPRPHLTGATPEDTRANLNAHLARSGAHRACDSFGHDALDALLEVVEAAQDPALLVAYTDKDGRHPSRSSGTLPALRDDQGGTKLHGASS